MATVKERFTDKIKNTHSSILVFIVAGALSLLFFRDFIAQSAGTLTGRLVVAFCLLVLVLAFSWVSDELATRLRARYQGSALQERINQMEDSL